MEPETYEQKLERWKRGWAKEYFGEDSEDGEE